MLQKMQQKTKSLFFYFTEQEFNFKFNYSNFGLEIKVGRSHLCIIARNSNQQIPLLKRDQENSGWVIRKFLSYENSELVFQSKITLI